MRALSLQSHGARTTPRDRRSKSSSALSPRQAQTFFRFLLGNVRKLCATASNSLKLRPTAARNTIHGKTSSLASCKIEGASLMKGTATSVRGIGWKTGQSYDECVKGRRCALESGLDINCGCRMMLWALRHSRALKDWPSVQMCWLDAADVKNCERFAP